jgi:hypothetical protein
MTITRETKVADLQEEEPMPVAKIRLPDRQ